MRRTVVITGAASGIGAATKRVLSSRGWRVIGVDRHRADINVDLSQAAGREAMVRAVEKRCGKGLDALIVCAGLASGPPTAMVAVNYFGAVASATGLRPLLARGKDPRAVIIASYAAIHPVDEAIVTACLAGDEAAAAAAAERAGETSWVYPSSKNAIARWLRREAVTPPWIGAGILLNGIAPGLVVTPMTQGFLDDPTVRPGVEASVPTAIGRLARPEEMAAVLAFLASPENSYMAGQVLFIDGGAEVRARGDDV